MRDKVGHERKMEDLRGWAEVWMRQDAMNLEERIMSDKYLGSEAYCFLMFFFNHEDGHIAR